MTRWSGAVAMVAGLSAAAAQAAVVTSPDPAAGLKAAADKLHSTVIEVRSVAAVTVAGKSAAVPTAMYGTGVLIGGGLAVTTLHSVGAVLPGKVAPWNDIEVMLPETGPASATIVGTLPQLDLAVIRIADADGLAAAPFAPEMPAEGDALIAMGIGDDAITAVGVQVAAIAGSELLLTTHRRLDSRFWGGPLFDAQGRLAGIHLASATPKAVGGAALKALIAEALAH